MAEFMDLLYVVMPVIVAFLCLWCFINTLIFESVIGSNLLRCFHMEGTRLSKKDFLNMITEISIDYRRHRIYCSEDIREGAMATIVDHSRLLFLSQNKIILYGQQYRLSFFTYLKYASFLKNMEKDVSLSFTSFVYRLNISI